MFVFNDCQGRHIKMAEFLYRVLLKTKELLSTVAVPHLMLTKQVNNGTRVCLGDVSDFLQNELQQFFTLNRDWQWIIVMYFMQRLFSRQCVVIEQFPGNRGERCSSFDLAQCQLGLMFATVSMFTLHSLFCRCVLSSPKLTLIGFCRTFKLDKCLGRTCWCQNASVVVHVKVSVAGPNIPH